MPKIAGMKFPYTEQGMKEADEYYKATDKPMELESGQVVPPNSVVQGQREAMASMMLKRALEQAVAERALMKQLQSNLEPPSQGSMSAPPRAGGVTMPSNYSGLANRRMNIPNSIKALKRPKR
jgi:hypothetical protein